MSIDLEATAAALDEAERRGTAIAQLGEDLTIDQAYAVQRQILALRQARGEAYVGPKLGFTSKAKMEQMGISDIIVGFLTDKMTLPNGGTLALENLVHPRIEPEIVFALADEVLVEDNDTTETLSAKLVDATDRVAAGLEIIDSRYRDFKFSLPDVVADNTSACRYVVGQWQPMRTELQDLSVTFEIDGEVVENGNTDAILGDPMRAFDQLASMALKYQLSFPAGSVILAGAMTGAVHLQPGQQIRSTVQGFAPVELNIAESSTQKGDLR